MPVSILCKQLVRDIKSHIQYFNVSRPQLKICTCNIQKICIQYLQYTEDLHTIPAIYKRFAYNTCNIQKICIQYLQYTEYLHTIPAIYRRFAYNTCNIQKICIQYLQYTEDLHTIPAIYRRFAYNTCNIQKICIQYLQYTEDLHTIKCITRCPFRPHRWNDKTIKSKQNFEIRYNNKLLSYLPCKVCRITFSAEITECNTTYCTQFKIRKYF